MDSVHYIHIHRISIVAATVPLGQCRSWRPFSTYIVYKCVGLSSYSITAQIDFCHNISIKENENLLDRLVIAENGSYEQSKRKNQPYLFCLRAENKKDVRVVYSYFMLYGFDTASSSSFAIISSSAVHLVCRTYHYRVPFTHPSRNQTISHSAISHRFALLSDRSIFGCTKIHVSGQFIYFVATGEMEVSPIVVSTRPASRETLDREWLGA